MLHAAGLSFRIIASQLNAEGLQAACRGVWFASTVTELIDRIEPSSAGG